MSCVLDCPACRHLRATALDVVGSGGIYALTMSRLASESGLTVDELRAHYPTAEACLYDTYEEVALEIYHEFASAFITKPRWRSALRFASSRLLARMAARPAEARLCFAEILQGDYELLRRREASRTRLVELFVAEFGKRCSEPEEFRIQLELLIGAGFQTIAAAVADAIAEDRLEELLELEPELESRSFVFDRLAA
jgi:hypothetical protein